MSCGVGRSHGSDPELLWLWCGGPIGPLPWEPPYAVGAAQEMAKRPKKKNQSSHCGTVETNPTQDPMLLWLWCRPAATTPIQSLAWELPYAMGVGLKSKKEKKEFVQC